MHRTPPWRSATTYNREKILECRGRIQGRYPIYLPDDSVFAEESVRHANQGTLHKDLGLTMAEVREKYWIPRLCKLAKKVVKSCWGCKRFHTVAQATPPPVLLTMERTEGSGACKIIGVDFAGAIKYCKSPQNEGKAYLVLYACSLSRAIHLEVLPNQDSTTFLGSFKRMVARRGRPAKVFSDNGKTFVGAARWLKQIQSNKKFQSYLSDKGIAWSFNLSWVPWWGDQFEGLIGLSKRAFYKTTGGGLLSWTELFEVVIEVETQLNRRPLSYVEDDVKLPPRPLSCFRDPFACPNRSHGERRM